MSYGKLAPANANVNNTLLPYSDSGYMVARAGTGSWDSSQPGFIAGQLRERLANGNYRNHVYQCMVELNIPGYTTGQLPVTAFTQYTHDEWDTNNYWSVLGGVHDWGGGPTTLEDYVPGSQLNSKPVVIEMPSMQTGSDNGKRPRFGGNSVLRDAFLTPQQFRMVLFSSNTLNGVPPSGGTNWGNPDYDVAYPVDSGAYIYGSTTSTTMSYVAGASVQLTDGTVAYLSIDTGSLQLRHTADGGQTSTLISTIAIGTTASSFRYSNGQQCFALVRDNDNNLFLFGPSGLEKFWNPFVFENPNAWTPSRHRYLAVQAFDKGAGYTWAARTIFTAPQNYGNRDDNTTDYGQYMGDINNIAAAYHDVGSGYVTAVVSHVHGSRFECQQYVVSVSCASALISNTPWADWGWGNYYSPYQTISGNTADVYYPMNDTGTGLDHIALPGTSGTGVYATFISNYLRAGQRSSTGYSRGAALFRYTLNSSGVFTTDPTIVSDGNNNWASPHRDCDGKIRLLPVGTTGYAVVTASGIGIFSNGHVCQRVLNANANGRRYPQLMYPPDIGAGLDERTVHFSPNWDALYDPATRSVVLYSIDTAAGAINWRNVIASHWNIDTTTPPSSERVVASATGASGSRNFAFRVPRQLTDVRKVLIHLGNIAAAGATSTLAVSDTGVNSPPNAPVLGPVSAFNAGAAKVFTWTFSDPNAGDTQSAYEMEIRRASDSVVVYQPGKVTSSVASRTVPANTLAASTNYQWRVRTYDANDLVGAWSSWTAFQTITGPVVSITDPAVDNAPWSSSSITITWDYSSSTGSTQSTYRVRVLRESNQAILYDSGATSSSVARSFTLPQGTLLTDVQQRLQVIVVDSNGLTSQPGLRLITPSFSTPPTPIIALAPSEADAVITLAITNPDPVGENPPVTQNLVYRRTSQRIGSASGPWELVGTTEPNEAFIDSTVANGVTYDYYVHGITAGTGTADSEILTEVAVSFIGVWLHTLTLPMRQFMYFAELASRPISPASQAIQFAGRARPVYAFGESTQDTITMTIDLPYSETWSDDKQWFELAAKPENQPVHFRNVRGTSEWCAMLVELVDTNYGTHARLTLTPVDTVDPGIAT